MTEPQLPAVTPKCNQHQHQDDRETALSPTMKIRGAELVDAVHQIPIRQIAIDVRVQPPAKWIHERCHRRRCPGPSPSLAAVRGANRSQRIARPRAQALYPCGEGVDCE